MDPLAEKIYKEEYKKSPNQGGSITPRFIVLHHSGGSFAGGVSWILQSKSKVSYHYLIDPDTGDRVQFVYDRKRAWHAGKSSWNGYNQLNGHSIGIAFAGDTHSREVSEVEIDSCAKKCIYLMNKFNLGLDSIVTHAMISPGRKDDCKYSVFKRVKERIEELLR